MMKADISAQNTWILQGGLTLETLEMILNTLRAHGSVLISLQGGNIPSLAELALEAHAKAEKK